MLEPLHIFRGISELARSPNKYAMFLAGVSDLEQQDMLLA